MTVNTSQTAQPHDLGPHTAADRDRYYAEGWWQDRVMYDFLKAGAAEHPERVFVTDGTSTATYGSLRDDVVRLATGLRSLGVEPGDRVAVQLPNWAEFATIMFALSRLGAILVPIMPIFRQEEVGYILRHSEAVVAIGPAFFHKFAYGAMYQELRPSAPALRDIVLVRSEDPVLADDLIAFDTLFANGDVEELDAALGATATADDPCLLVYTSGTTSRPKGCYHTFNTLHAAARETGDVLEITSDDVAFNPSPVAHSTGLVTGIILPLVAGGGTHFQPVWDRRRGAAAHRAVRLHVHLHRDDVPHHGDGGLSGGSARRLDHAVLDLRGCADPRPGRAGRARAVPQPRHAEPVRALGEPRHDDVRAGRSA